MQWQRKDHRSAHLEQARSSHFDASGPGSNGCHHPRSRLHIGGCPAARDCVCARVSGIRPHHRLHPALHRWAEPGDGSGSILRQLLRAHALPVYYGGSCGSRGWAGGASTGRSHRGLTCKIPPVSPVRIDGRVWRKECGGNFFLAGT